MSKYFTQLDYFTPDYIESLRQELTKMLDNQDIGAINAIGLPYTPVSRLQTYGAALMKSLLSFDYPSGIGQIWISGEAGLARELNAFFRLSGFSKSQLKVKPYWSLKGHAHRKAFQKEL